MQRVFLGADASEVVDQEALSILFIQVVVLVDASDKVRDTIGLLQDVHFGLLVNL